MSVDTSLVEQEWEILPVRVRSQPAEIRGNVLYIAKTRGTAHVAVADYHQRASPSDTSQELVF